MELQADMSNAETELRPTKFGFLLLHDFSLISLAAAIEPLRMANRILASDHFSWKLISERGEFVSASDGVALHVETDTHKSPILDNIDVIIVCSGTNVETNFAHSTLKWLKVQAQHGIALGSICTGAYVLAKAGLLEGYRCSIHWENLATLRESFPFTQISSRVFSIDNDRFTSSGGTAPLDMMIFFICQQHGNKIGAEIAEQFVHERIRSVEDNQRIPLQHSPGNLSQKLVAAVELMEANLEEPINQKELADYIGLSKRQLERLFNKYLECNPSRYYLQLRLQRAQQLLRQSSLSILEVSSVCGFVSTSHFSKSYKDLYGYSPSLERTRKCEKTDNSKDIP